MPDAWEESGRKLFKLFSDNRSVCGDLNKEGAFTFKEGLDEFFFLVESLAFILGLHPTSLPNILFPALGEILSLTSLVNMCKPTKFTVGKLTNGANSSKRERNTDIEDSLPK